MRGLLKTYYQKNNPQGAKQDQILRQSRSGSVAGILQLNASKKDVGGDDSQRPKTKEEQKLERQKERDRVRVLKAADRRENWISMVVNDPEFLEGFKNGSLPLFHTEHLKLRDFSSPGAMTGLTGSIPKTSMEKHPLNKIPTYSKADYDEKQPVNHPQFRDRIFGREVTSPIVKHTHKDQLERIQDKIQGTPKLSTEPINTLLLSRPQWREHDESKWVGGKEFQSMNSRKDQGWQPLQNVKEEYREPFIENKVRFRDISSNNHTTIIPLTSSNSKRRNNSQIRTQIVSVKGSIFRNSPSRSSGRGGDTNSKGSGGSPAPEPQLFDSTIPADKTWKNRMIQSNSLRQKHHLDQSLKLRKNLLQKEYEHNVVDMRTQIAMSENANVVAAQIAIDLPKQVLPSTADHPVSPPQASLGKPERMNSFDIKPFSPFTQQAGSSPLKFQPTSYQQQQKPPLPKKEHVINLGQLPPDLAAGYLNHDFQNSYSQAWQYNVVVKAPVTYFNRKYEEKEELRDAHILWEMDRERTYYKSAMEKIQPQKIREQVELEKQRRSNMIMALNNNIMDKTQQDEFQKSSISLQKLPSSKRQQHRKITSSHGIMVQNQAEKGIVVANGGDVYDKTNINGYLNTYSGSGSPIKQQMNQTQPRGFMSPKGSSFGTAVKRLDQQQLNKQDIREVVKSYFDRNVMAHNRNYSPSAKSQLSSPMAKQSSQLKQDQLVSHDTQIIQPFHLSPVKQNSH